MGLIPSPLWVDSSPLSFLIPLPGIQLSPLNHNTPPSPSSFFFFLNPDTRFVEKDITTPAVEAEPDVVAMDAAPTGSAAADGGASAASGGGNGGGAGQAAPGASGDDAADDEGKYNDVNFWGTFAF